MEVQYVKSDEQCPCTRQHEETQKDCSGPPSKSSLKLIKDSRPVSSFFKDGH